MKKEEISSIVSRLFNSTEDRESLLFSRCKMSDVIIFDVLFHPELVEIDGSVLLKRLVNSDEMVSNFRNTVLQVGIEEAERQFNFTEFSFLFDANGRDIDDATEELIASLIIEYWTDWLIKNFQNRSFFVESLTARETGSVPGACFCEIRKKG